MDRVGIDTLTIHGDKDQADRDLALTAFRTDACKILIATDVSARGIDVSGVHYVVNYDIPDVARKLCTQSMVEREGAEPKEKPSHFVALLKRSL